MNRRVLLVDDEDRVLQGYRRTLRKQFDIATAHGGTEALAEMEANGPYAVVVSDFRMPGMDGVELLTEVRRQSPDTIRMMLTGQADMNAIIAAINEGDVFRFMTKPCPSETLAASLETGIEQYRLVQAEQELLEQTLRRTVEVLIDVLGLVDPSTHRESSGLRDRVGEICTRMGLDNAWEFEVAALLSQLGTIALPTDAVDKYRRGEPLGEDDRALMDQHPQSAYSLLVKIPRMERIARMVLSQSRPPGSRPVNPEAPDDDDVVAMGAHLLDVALTYERLIANRRTAAEALDKLRRQAGPPFRTAILDALASNGQKQAEWLHLRAQLDDLEPGMKLEEDVEAKSGLLLLAEGQSLTDAHLERLRRFAATSGIVEPIRVLVQQTA